MSAANVTQFLIDITRGHRRDEFATDPERVLAGSPLDEDMRAAVRAQDMAALWLAGAHPMALLYFARACRWDNERYYRCIGDAELRKAAAAPGAASAGHAPPRTHR